jgi:hypothetical protein
VCAVHGQWSDDFEAYADGSAIAGQGGWEEWFGSSGVSGHISTLFSNSPTKSLNIDGDGPDPAGDDTVHQFSVTGGKWTFKIMTYVPTNAVGTAYIILLNRYPSFNWSLQVHLDATANLVRIDRYQAQQIQATLIKGQWVEFRAEIDLDNDKVDYFYNGVEILSDWSWKNGVSGNGDPSIKALDLYGGEPGQGGTSGTYFDDVSLMPATTTEELCPYKHVVMFGSLVSGSISDVCNSDDNRMVFANGSTFLITQSPITVQFFSTSTIANPTEVKMTVEYSVSLVNLMARFDMRNYATGLWEQVDQRPASLSDEVVTASKTTNASDYRDSTNGDVGIQVRVRDDSPAFLATWQGRYDQIKSTVTG